MAKLSIIFQIHCVFRKWAYCTDGNICAPGTRYYCVTCRVSEFYVLTQTMFGRQIYALGGNREAVRLSGINIEKLEIKAYVINGALAAIGAIILVGRLNAAQPIAGNGYELDAIAATVIGGTSLMGGVGSVVSTSIGALIMGCYKMG